MAAKKFKKGQSGNPAGRPPGSKDRRTEMRELLKPHAEALVNLAVSKAKKGNMVALRMCIDRIIPPYRATDPTLQLDELTGTLSEQGQQILTAMAKGKLAPSDASSLLQALSSQARIVENDEIIKRIMQIEEKLNVN